MTSRARTCSVFYNQAGNSNYNPRRKRKKMSPPVFTSADNHSLTFTNYATAKKIYIHNNGFVYVYEKFEKIN